MEEELKEIVYPKNEIQYSDKECPNCKEKKMSHGPISCPDGLPGCCVLHFGYTCYNCGKVFQ